MSIVNRRNALLGWSVWMALKSVGKKKSKKVVRDSANPKKKAGAVAGALVAVMGALLVWRRRGSGDSGV